MFTCFKMLTDNSDYIVEQYIRPNKVRKPIINDERADLLGNFDDDDAKFKKKKSSNVKPMVVASEEDPFAEAEAVNEDEKMNENEDQSDDTADEQDGDSSNDDSDGNVPGEKNEIDKSDGSNASNKPEISTSKGGSQQRHGATKTKRPIAENSYGKLDLTDEQIQALIRGCSKKDRFVLYITNLNYSTTREALSELFSAAGPVKSVRVPKVRRSAFAFVEMSDINGFKNALTFHNRTLDNYTIKVQISEAGKKKSANKKNILKQKNRKLAEMRNEAKQFQRSGKGYDKTLKKEIHQRKMQQNRRLAKKNKKKMIKNST